MNARIAWRLTVEKGLPVDELFGFKDTFKRLTNLRYTIDTESTTPSVIHEALLTISKMYSTSIFRFNWVSLISSNYGIVYYWNGKTVSTSNTKTPPDLRELPGLMQDYPELLL